LKLPPRLGALGCALTLAACATPPAPPGTVVPESRLAGAVVPGQTTKAALLASLGPTMSIAFDSGYEVWLYQSPAGGGRYAEFVVLLDPKGVVSKVRRRDPPPSEPH
jgi:hypothetical protein